MTTTIASTLILVLCLRAAPRLRLGQRHIRLPVIFCCAALSGCSHLVKITPSPGALLHTSLSQPTTNWESERVQVVLTPSLRGEPLKYLANSEGIFLANALRQRGLRHVYKINGIGTPLVVYSRNPEVTAKDKHYPRSGIVLV